MPMVMKTVLEKLNLGGGKADDGLITKAMGAVGK